MPATTLDATTVNRVTRELLARVPGASTIAIGLHRAGQRALVLRGTTAHSHDGGGVPTGPATRFEIGSLTKTFTALLLAEQASRGELNLNDTLAQYLPPDTLLPPGGKAITLTHLATHTSGLPCHPTSMLRSAAPRLFTNPYADFTRGDALNALARTRLRAAPGTRVHYSNFAVGLLGHALTAAAGNTPYADLLSGRVLRPLGLHDTNCVPAPLPEQTQATGYRRRSSRPLFRIPGLPAAGALRSSPRDLLAFVEHLLEPSSSQAPSSLRTALSNVLQPRLQLPHRSSRGLALMWNTRPRPDGTLVYHHSGATCGFHAFIGFNPQHRTALIALANTKNRRGSDIIQPAYTALMMLHQH
ncbi:serine hydrolase domain-containing protein [Streptomyces flaveolus]|uniref:serine hydrolase domain-containing protein n=1 Tax=Streptomyces flaveolus TaxID=67297 RepID=UPI0036FF9A3E